MFVLSFQPFPCYRLPLLPRRLFPFSFFSFPPSQFSPFSPSVLDDWYTISFVSHFFPSPLPSHPLPLAPFMRLLPTHAPAFSIVFRIAVLLLTSFIQQLFPSDSRKVKVTWGWTKAELGIDCGKKRESKNDWCWKGWEKRLLKSYWVKHLERIQKMSSLFCFGSYKDEVYVISK